MKTKERFVVYVLTDPVTREPKYIGMTRQPEARRRFHCEKIVSRPYTRVQAWTSTLVAAGTPPVFRIVADIRYTETYVGNTQLCSGVSLARIAERRAIEEAIAAGADLLNYKKKALRD